MTRVWNCGPPKRHVFDLWKKNKYLSHFKKKFVSLVRTTCLTFYPVFLVWTPPVTNSTQWISGITDHHITVDKELQEVNRFTSIVTDMYSFVLVFCISVSILWDKNYLATQVILVFSKGKRFNLKALEVRRILNSGISPNRMEDHLVRVHRVYTAER